MYIPIIAFSTHIWIQLSRFYNHKPLPGDLLEGQSVKLGELANSVSIYLWGP